MSFILTLHDHHGKELALGDIVRVNTGTVRPNHFFARVTWLKDEQTIAPFGTFSFHSFEKVDSLPDNAIKSTETRYDIWYLEDEGEEQTAEIYEGYLMSWRECEDYLKKNCYRIRPNTQLGLFANG